jgi:CBS domain-containing protein
VQEAARLMMEKKIGCLPVLEGAQLVGIVTETDMLKLVAEM